MVTEIESLSADVIAAVVNFNLYATPGVPTSCKFVNETTPAFAVAVKLLKVAPTPLATLAVITLELSLVTRFPKRSRNCKTGWPARLSPVALPPTGWVIQTSCDAAAWVS